MPGVFLLSPGPVFADPNQQAVQSNATLIASSSAIFTGYGAAEVSLFINVKAAPTGTLPTLQYTIQEVDPGDGLTVIGPTVSSTVISAIGIERITLESAFGGAIKVSWVLTGTLPSFTQVYATLVAKQASVKVTDGTNTASVTGANALRTDGSAVTQPVSVAGELQTGVSDMAEVIKVNLRPIQRALGLAVDPSTGRLRAAIDINAAQTLATVTTVSTVTTVTTVTTVGAVTSLNQLAGFDAKSTLLYSGERTMWAENIRSRIS